MPESLHLNTPTLLCIDSRGLDIRQISVHRSTLDGAATLRIHAQHFDVAGRVIAAWDPRLFASRHENPAITANITTIHSLSGTALSSQSVDSGTAITLLAESGAPVDRWDSRQTHWQTEYDNLLRPSAIREKMAAQDWRVCERLSYSDNDTASVSNNLCGQLVRVDDEAGTHEVIACNLTGGVTQEKRRLLENIALPDWPDALVERDALLEPTQAAITQRRYDATGTETGLTDVRGNRQNIGLNVCGHLTQVTLWLSNGNEHVLLQDVQYNALGQIQSQVAGNGIVSLYTYEETDERLRSLISQRGANDPLQSLTYAYDPVGNVLSITDNAQPTRHFANQRIDPVNRFIYDSLYQLIEASGRETVTALNGPQLPELIALPVDSSQWLNYTEHYSYDSAGNLLQLRHEGNHAYTRDMRVDAGSNRAVAWQTGDAPPDFSRAFDACGNLQRLAPGQTLSWSAQNRLLQVCSVTRDDAEDDAERYSYDGNGQRLRKTATALTRAGSHIRDVRYLPGIELRNDTATGEELEVIIVQAGRCAVLCLHWAKGKPAEIEDNQLRYSMDDHLGSSTLELDANAQLISHEGYYPYGGTAWWVARSIVEATYKVVRYSGKERDASGLYYYGLRYYAPWLWRWIVPDPGGSVDGMNMYRMTWNNPIRLTDPDGGQSADASAILLYAFSLLLAFAAGVFYSQWRNSPATAPPESPLTKSIVPVRDKHGLIGDEVHVYRQFLAVQRIHADDSKLKEHSSGAIYAYNLQNREHRKYFNKNSNLGDFNARAMIMNIPFVQLRKDDENEIERLEARRGSVQSAMSLNSSNYKVGEFSEASVIRRKQTTKKTEAATPLGSEVSASGASVPKSTTAAGFTVDVNGFLEDPKISKWLNKNQSKNMRAGVEVALKNFSPNRKGHIGLLGMHTTDIHITGSASGRGDYRLGFTKSGNVFRPEAILTHKGNGHIEVRRNSRV